MIRLIPILLLAIFTFTGCDKSEVNKPQGPLPVTDAVKTGDWMVTYFENNASMDIGLIFLKFSPANTLTATRDGANYSGTWSETNTGGNNTLMINIATTDADLKKANGSWKVTNIAEYFIDLKDPNVSSHATVQLMKH